MKKERIVNLIGLLLILGALVCIYFPHISALRWWSRYATQISVAYWLLGILFLCIRQTRLTMFAFAASGMLALYLRSTTNTALLPPNRTNEPILKLGHFNLSSATDVFPTISKILTVNADVISVQEISPEWVRPISDTLGKYYPYRCMMLGTDLYSFGMFSKYPIADCDTIYCGDAPNLVVRLQSKIFKQELLLLASYIEPPLFEMARQQQKIHFDSLTKFVTNKKMPTITLGNYNIESNAPEIQTLRQTARLNDSRRGFRPLRDNGHISLLEVPIDHIFYTNHFQCVDFQTLSGSSAERIGIIGSYQFVKDSLK